MDLASRVEKLERDLRRARVLSALSFVLALGMAGWIGASFRRPLHVSSVVVTAPNGARTTIEGGHIRLEERAGNHVNVQVTDQTSTISLATHERDPVAPEITLRVGDRRTPASLLLSDRKARNFEHVYISGGRAGIEQAGVREYQNIATP